MSAVDRISVTIIIEKDGGESVEIRDSMMFVHGPPIGQAVKLAKEAAERAERAWYVPDH